MIPCGSLPEFAYRTQRNYHRGFPWFGDDCASAWSPNRQFNVAFKVYALPLRDCSRPDNAAYDEFDRYVDHFRSMHHIGDCVNAIAMDGEYTLNDVAIGNATSIYGRILKIEVDYENKRIRVFLVHGDCSDVDEVYPETIFDENFVQESLSKKLIQYKKINEKRV